MTGHKIEAKRNRYNDGFEAKGDVWIEIPELRNHYFAIASCDKGRAIHQGPIMQNGYAFLNGRPLVIDNHGGSAAERERNGHITVKLGDSIEFAGKQYRVEDCGDRYNAELIALNPESESICECGERTARPTRHYCQRKEVTKE